VTPKRLLALETRTLVDGTRAFVADTPLARLLGLAWLDELPADRALLIPRCRSVHTFGMRFPLELSFLDGDGRVLLRLDRVQPGRVVWRRGATAVLERPARPASRRAGRA
jgi:uncharacterized membrane protein (UPF0127 family)